MFGVDIGLAIAVTSAVISTIGWYGSQVKNRYTRERESAHILKNLEQQNQAFTEVFKDFDRLDDRLSRLEVLLIRRGMNHED